MLPFSENPYRPPAANLGEHRELDDADDVLWTNGVVSIWTGSFPSVDAAENYFEETFRNDSTPVSQFAADFGFRAYRSDSLEYHFDQVAAQPFASLLERCSFQESFAAEALKSAAAQGILSTQGIALLFNFDYRRSSANLAANMFLRFLGAFPFVIDTGIPWLNHLHTKAGRHPAAFLTILDALRAARASAPDKQIRAPELCEAIRRHVVETYGPDAQSKLVQFGITSSEAVGEAVYEMVAEGVMHQQEGDHRDDFRGLFTLKDWFAAS